MNERKLGLLEVNGVMLFVFLLCWLISPIVEAQAPPSPGGARAVQPDKSQPQRPPVRQTAPGSRPGQASPGSSPGQTAPGSRAGQTAPGSRAGQAIPALRAGTPEVGADGEEMYDANYPNTPIDMVLQEYADVVGRTLLFAPGLPKGNVTLVSQDSLAREDFLDALETLLSMHQVGLLPIGEKFIKVVPIKTARSEPMEILEGDQDVEHPETSKLVSQIIQLKHVEIAEISQIIEPLKHPYGTVQLFERNNSILLTDTAATVNRIAQIVRYIDKAVPAKEQPDIIQIQYAKASEIKGKLEEIIAESQKEQQQKKATIPRQKSAGQPGVQKGSSSSGIIRARPITTPSASAEPVSVEQLEAEAARGIIRGTVKIIADDRTNKLIIITRPENMTFFKKVVEWLDIKTVPNVLVKVVRLEYAEAKNIAGMLNDLIGAQTSEDATPRGKAAADAGKPGTADGPRDYRSTDSPVKKPEPVAKKAATPRGKGQPSELGELSSENIKILSDERTNALIIMARREDFTILEGIIDDMDMMLSQVLIESCILEVELSDNLQAGVDWVQRSMIAYDGGEDDDTREALFSFAGGGGGGNSVPKNTTDLLSVEDVAAGSGLTYYFTHFGLSLDMVIRMATSDSRTRILSSPVIVTHDNTEAKISSSEERYFYKGKRWVGSSSSGTYEDDVERRKVGLHLTVTPHINENKLVVMEISQEVEQLAGTQTIGDNDWPIVNIREMSASVAVQNKETIVLGGLIKSEERNTEKGIPVLSKIPILGWLFGYKSKDDVRSEIVVFITPYVLDTPEEMYDESVRRKRSVDIKGMWPTDWSDSKMGKDSGDSMSADEAETEELDQELRNHNE